MNKETMAKAFDLWMDEYLNHPERFEQMAATIQRHLQERSDGSEHTYGESCTATLIAYCERIESEALAR